MINLQGWITRGINLASGPIARSSIQSLFIKIAATGLAFGQAVLFARMLGAEGYGTVASALSVAQLIATISLFGLHSYAIRAVPMVKVRGQTDELRAILRFGFGLAAVSALTFASIAFLTANGLKLAPSGILYPAFMLIMILAAAKLSFAYLQGIGAPSAAQLPPELLQPVLIVSGGVLAIAASSAISPIFVLWLVAGSATIATMISIASLIRLLPKEEHEQSTTFSCREHLREAAPFFWLSVAAIVLVELNTLLLTALSSTEQVALYQPIARFAALLTIPAQAIAMRYAPKAAELHSAGKISELRQISRLFTWTTTIIMAGASAALLVSGEFLLGLFGQGFTQMLPALIPITIAQLINVGCGPVQMLLVASGQSRTAMRGEFLCIAIILCLALNLIPQFGAMGAVWALCIMTGTINLIRLVQVRRLLGFWPMLG